MKKLLLVVSVTLILCSCGGGSSSGRLTENKANQIIDYYNNSLSVLKKFYKEKEMENVLQYMDRNGQAVSKPVVMIGIFSDSSKVINPGSYFDREIRAELQEKYRAFFDAGNKFFDNYEKFNAYLAAEGYKEDNWEKGKTIYAENMDLYDEVNDLRYDIYAILIPIADEAEKVTLVDNPLRSHILKAKDLFTVMEAAIDEYAEEEVDADAMHDFYERINELLEEVRELKPNVDYDRQMKYYSEFLEEIGAFQKELIKSIKNNKFDQQGFEDLMSEYNDAVGKYNSFVN
ncbi:MAG: YiiG family protein [Rikenellaceae bacterium]|nr:YiiG family protein [Rikenellaceae bacterium]